MWGVGCGVWGGFGFLQGSGLGLLELLAFSTTATRTGFTSGKCKSRCFERREREREREKKKEKESERERKREGEREREQEKQNRPAKP